jgi:hypothetical protein
VRGPGWEREAVAGAAHHRSVEGAGAGNVEADGLWLDGMYFAPLELAVDGLRNALASGEDLEDREFLETVVLARLEFCRAHDLVFVVY